MNYWLFKSEPNCFSIDDLQKVKTEPWDGIRNYQARNFLKNETQIGDKVIFYHSSCKIPAAVGVAQVASKAYPDHTAWDPDSDHPDPKSPEENPRWYMVDVSFVSKFKAPVSLKAIKELPPLQNMTLVKKGNRLSLFPITEDEFNFIVDLGK